MSCYNKYKTFIIFGVLIYFITIYMYSYETASVYFMSNTKKDQPFGNIAITDYKLLQTKSIKEPEIIKTNITTTTINSNTKSIKEPGIIKNNITTTTLKSNTATTKLVPKKVDPFICFKNFTKSSFVVHNISDVEIKPGRTIFFLETSCRSNVLNQITLNARQGCAIESAALAHPNLDVVLLVLSSNVLGSSVHPVVNSLTKNYKNIRILHVNIDQYFKGTPVENLLTSGRMLESSFPMIHMSDVLRYLTLWKYGGIYFDLDVLIVKNFEDLGPNFTGPENPGTVAAGLLGFDAKGLGHSWVESILNRINSTYKPKEWSYNALAVLQMELQIICNTTTVTKMTRENCQDFNLLPKLAFYEIDWSVWRFFFESNHTDYVMKIMSKPEVKAAHLWNKLSQNTVPEKRSAYRVLAAIYCPLVYNMNENNF